MRLALARTGGFGTDGGEFTIPVEPLVARLLSGSVGTEVVILPRDRHAGNVGLALLRGVETVRNGGDVARFERGRLLGTVGRLADQIEGPFPLQLLADDNYIALIGAADVGLFSQAASITPELDEAGADFSSPPSDAEPPILAMLDSLRRESGNLCSLTGLPLEERSLPTVIRSEGADRYHLNNLLLLSTAAGDAFRYGHFTVRDDFSVLVDLSRIDPELLEKINPLGRLRVPANPALQPAAANLAWHRTVVFGVR